MERAEKAFTAFPALFVSVMLSEFARSCIYGKKEKSTTVESDQDAALTIRQVYAASPGLPAQSPPSSRIR